MEHSIVIPAWNHPDRLASCLGSILDARNGSREYEVLVMDNSDVEYRAVRTPMPFPLLATRASGT